MQLKIHCNIFLPHEIVLASFSFAWKVCIHSMYLVSQVSKLLSWGNFRLIVDAVLLRWCNNNIFGSPTTLHIVNEKGHPIFDGDWAIMSNQHSQIRLFWGHFQSECFGLSSLETKQTRGKKPRNQVKSTHVSSNGHQCVKRRHTQKKSWLLDSSMSLYGS